MKDIQIIKAAQTWLMEKGPDFVLNLIVFILILIIGSIAIKITKGILKKVLNKVDRINETLERFLINVAGKVMWVVLLMVALPRVGVDIAPLVAGLGVTGFIVGFAFQESLGNLAAGLMIILNQPFLKGHYVEAAGHAGTVNEVNMMATTLTSPDNKKIVIPNSKIWGGSIVNYSAFDIRRVDMTAGISYDADIGEAKAVITKVLDGNELILKDPAWTIEVVEMADSSVNFVVRPWTKTADYWNVYFAVTRGIKESLDKAGIGIPFPQVDVHHYGTESAPKA